jgi:hypothetical protein
MKCTECGGDFRQNRSWQHFCSEHCRNKHNNRDFREAQRAFEISASGDVREVSDKIKTAIREMAAKRVDKSRPEPRRMFRPRVPKAELWDRDQRLEMAKLADDFLEEKAKARA